MHEKLKAGLEGMGLKYVVEASARLPQLNSIYMPEVVIGSTDDDYLALSPMHYASLIGKARFCAHPWLPPKL